MKYNHFSLEGKSILVTGASSGIGKAIAIECSKVGANLIITGRNIERLTETYKELQGNNHKQIVADLYNEEDIKNIIYLSPKLDGLVLAAGMVTMSPVMFATKEKFNKIYDINLFAPINLLKAVIKNKKIKENFAVVAIGSIAGTRDIGVANGIYGSGKAALISFMKYAALELASKNIRINTISPGLILTPMHTNGVIEEERLREETERIPLKKWGTPNDIAYGTIFLLSDASSYITGTDLCIDGGLTI